MRVLFMGSAEIACPALQSLLETPGIDIVALITQPDRPAGRQRHTMPCAAKLFASERNLQILTPENVNAPAVQEHIRTLKPDIGVVMAYGQILKKNVLDIPPLGFINLHTSLLPKYRGAAPIQRAIANGDAETGITMMQMDTGMDTGDMLLKRATPIHPDDTAATLHDRLAAMAAGMLPGMMVAIRDGLVVRTPQNHQHATLAPKLTKQEGRILWKHPARKLVNQIRGFDPWPGTYCLYHCSGREQTLKIMEARAVSATLPVPPGTVISIDKGPCIACGEGSLKLKTVKPEGGKTMRGEAFVCGRPIRVGDRFD